MPQEISIALVGTLVDDENFPFNDETKAINVQASGTLTPEGGEIEVLKADECAGDEVRLIPSVTAKLLGDGRTVRVHALLRLYEGTACDTTDPEGPDVSYARSVAPSRTIRLDVRHPGDGGGSFSGFLHVSNRTV